MQPIRFAILGFGYHAAFRLVPSFRNCASTPPSRASIAETPPRPPAMPQRTTSVRSPPPKELCASPEVDAVFITSPDALHLPDAQLAFAHHKPVLCEKPLAATAGQADAMLAAANASGQLFGVAHHYRWAHAIQQIRSRVAAGEIGEPRTAHAEFNYAAQFSRRPWITDPTLAAGGPVGDVGVHCIDTPPALSSTTHALAASPQWPRQQDERSGAVEASASMQFEFCHQLSSPASTSQPAAQYRTQIEIVGADGVLVRRKRHDRRPPRLDIGNVPLRQQKACTSTRTR